MHLQGAPTPDGIGESHVHDGMGGSALPPQVSSEEAGETLAVAAVEGETADGVAGARTAKEVQRGVDAASSFGRTSGPRLDFGSKGAWFVRPAVV